MDFSLNDSAWISDAFETSASVVPSTPIHPSRKRKREPPLSSTSNESLIDNFNQCSLSLGGFSLPATPERPIYLDKIAPSPVQEILYERIAERKGHRILHKPLRREHVPPLFRKVLTNTVIMKTLFPLLSDGDLFRWSQVCPSSLDSINNDQHAMLRLGAFLHSHKYNKENYRITPPSSPEKCDSPPRTNSEQFDKSIRLVRLLTQSQTLAHCNYCRDQVVVQNNICQCQSSQCGIIYCLKCESFTTLGPQHFKDKCGGATLQPLGNSTNKNNSRYFNFSGGQDSGFYSENESPKKVKRTLFKEDTPKTLSINNRNVKNSIPRRKQSLNVVPVVANVTKVGQRVDSDSPTKCSPISISLKQRKKFLKRLTQ